MKFHFETLVYWKSISHITLDMIISCEDTAVESSNDVENMVSGGELACGVTTDRCPRASGDHVTSEESQHSTPGHSKDIETSVADCCQDDSCRICSSVDSQAPWYSCIPLNAAEVRWFRRDIAVSNSKWSPFNGYDSRKLECAYRRMQSHCKGINKTLHDNKCPVCKNNPYTVGGEKSNTSLCSNKQCCSQANTTKGLRLNITFVL